MLKTRVLKYTISKLEWLNIEPPQRELRCLKCGRLLAKYQGLTNGIQVIKCRRCNVKNIFRFRGR